MNEGDRGFRSILVDVDATASVHPALERATRIAGTRGAQITIVDIVPTPGHSHRDLPAGLEEAAAQERRAQLDRLVDGVTNVPAEARVLTGRPAIALIQEVLRSNHDLLIRSHARDLVSEGSKTIGVVDMELLRKCPCPVLLVRQSRPAPEPTVAGAVNTSTDDARERALNRKIVETTVTMTRLLTGRSTVILHAWAPFGESIVRGHSTVEQFGAYAATGRQHAETDLARLVQSLEGAPPDLQMKLLEGEPEDVIPQFVVADGIDLLVMGTTARAGVAGMLIGNTAERILRRLTCSVLTIKPDGFVSPVRLDDV